MSFQSVASFPFPWGAGIPAFVKSVTNSVKASGVVMAITSPGGVSRVVLAHGVRAKDRRAWTGDLKNLPLPSKHHHLIATSDTRMPGSAIWTLAISRLSPEFTSDESMRLSVLLNQCRAYFDIPEDDRMGRVLTTKEGQCLDADPQMLYLLSSCQTLWQHLFTQAMRVVAQRWPDVEQDVTRPRDMVLKWQDEPTWIRCFMMDEIFYFELRGVGVNDVPVVAEVEDPRVARALGYVDDHYMKSPKLEDVAGFLQVSAFHFHRLFNSEVGVTPKHYALSKQIQVAKWMLRHSLGPIADIAEKTGFSSHGHFTATFRRIVGLSPREYRELFTQ